MRQLMVWIKRGMLSSGKLELVESGQLRGDCYCQLLKLSTNDQSIGPSRPSRSPTKGTSVAVRPSENQYADV